MWKFAKAHGYRCGFGISPYAAASGALEKLGHSAEGLAEKAFCLKHALVIFESVRAMPKVAKLAKKAPEVHPEHLAYVMTDAFLSSYEWRRVRMEALKKYGPVCQCCGASPATGAVINVDHIKPRRVFPELALTVENLQILCHECNHGKGNWDMTDWRVNETKQLTE
jgi:hypothetical protein